jgi:uncharacterized metal-binding protein YceD (DUF177 family)
MNNKIITLNDVPIEGVTINHTIIDPKELHKLAQLLEIRKLISASLSVFIVPFKDGLHIKGKVKAEIEQECVITLETLHNKVNEKLDLTFLPDVEVPDFDDKDLEGEALQALLAEEDPPEPLINGQINLTDLLVEFIALGIDPYPRIDGAEFKDPNAEVTISPFEALKKLGGS